VVIKVEATGVLPGDWHAGWDDFGISFWPHVPRARLAVLIAGGGGGM